jgi:2-polyprenyl-3-methyl-5-hydroxy-6-metoxy-1,4-benzoquinol methylase
MIAEMEQLEYETKPSDYFQCPRPEMLPFVPVRCKRVLDVGCAEGAFGESLKMARGIEVWGVEPTTSAAVIARARLDNVIEGIFGPELNLPTGTFDCILFNDVLEHMLAPEKALRYARGLLAPGGVIVASIPNVRNFPIVWDLVRHARWEYRDCGVLDRTHLRFFTKLSIIQMFEREGFSLDKVCGIKPFSAIPRANRVVWWAYRALNVISFGNFHDMRFLQIAIVARPATRFQNGGGASGV